MKPRIFVSSTFYDLKYIREDLANFIKAHDFEPILFEDGDIGYNPLTNLDDSSYKSMESADMALLIVGGNYGSPATGETPDNFKEFMSITRREFQRGVDEGVPFFVFVDRNVYAEYGIFDLNSKEIESGECSIKFKATKNINVFRFIREIRSIKQISITEFDKVADIKDFLSKQWADMFKTYLASIKEQKEIEQLKDSINSMNVLMEKMDKILDVVGKEVLKDSEEEYQQIVEETERAEAKSVCLRIAKCVKIGVIRKRSPKRRDHVMAFLTALNDMYDQQVELATEHNISPEDIQIDEANVVARAFEKALEESGMIISSMRILIHEEINSIHPYLQDPDKMKEVYALLCSGPYYYRVFRVINDPLDEDDRGNSNAL